MGEGSANHTDPHHTPTFIQPSTSQPQKKQKPRKAKRKDTQIPQSSGPTEHVSMRGLFIMRLTVMSVKSKVKGDVVEELSVPVSAAITKVSASTTTTIATIPTPRKGIIITELALEKKIKISFDEQEAIRLQAEFDKDKRHTKEKDKANVALTKEWDDIQAKVDADYQLAQRLQAEEQEQFTTEQKATLFKELLEQRRKNFAAKRAKEKRNTPPTKTQQKKNMITYLKNMEGWKYKDLKSKDFDSIKELFDKAFKRVNMFMDYRTDLVEGSSKRAGDELEQEVTKKKKVDDVQETAEVDDNQETTKIKELMEIVLDEEEVAIDAIPLATGNGYPTKGRKIKQKRTKPSTEWKSMEKTKLIEAKVNKSQSQPRQSQSQEVIKSKKIQL
ncbi:hypothetical protein Tco_1204679 [Tanacetum coccineum]